MKCSYVTLIRALSSSSQNGARESPSSFMLWARFRSDAMPSKIFCEKPLQIRICHVLILKLFDKYDILYALLPLLSNTLGPMMSCFGDHPSVKTRHLYPPGRRLRAPRTVKDLIEFHTNSSRDTIGPFLRGSYLRYSFHTSLSVSDGQENKMDTAKWNHKYLALMTTLAKQIGCQGKVYFKYYNKTIIVKYEFKKYTYIHRNLKIH